MMKGIEVLGHGSLPFISGLSSGYAAAMGIDLPLKINIEVIPDSRDVEFVVMGEWDRDTKLIDRIKKDFISRYINKKNFGLKIKIESAIPANVGLKSGVSVAVYTIFGVSQILNLPLSENDIIHIAMNISRTSGSYLLGSLEGIYASFKGGVVYTDNMGGRVISWFTNVPDCSIVIGYKPRIYENILHTTREIRKYGELFKKIFDVGQKGGHLKAVTLNGLLFSLLTNMDYEILVETLSRGAIAAGIAGTGPSISIFAEHDDIDHFKELLSNKGYKVLVTQPTTKGCSYKYIE